MSPGRQLALGAGLVAFLQAAPIQAALYWFAGVRTSPIRLCFVGDAVTSRPNRVQEVRDHIRRMSNAANITFSFLGACPAPTKLANGNDSFDGDIRVLLSNISGTKIPSWAGAEGTGPIPGAGCPAFLDSAGNYNGGNNGWGSWSNGPNDLAKNRSCLYNLKLGDDPWNAAPFTSHTLHEFGHGLGLSHEHERNDASTAPACTTAGFGGGASNGFMTAYDRFSVMHYAFPACGIEGNYSYVGLSQLDALALHILYPQNVRVAEIVGRRVIRNTESLNLGSSWQVRGANMSFVNASFQWRIDGSLFSSGNSGSVGLSLGTHTLQVQQEDFLGRQYEVEYGVTVLTPAEYARRVTAPVAARAALF
jgi:hypothetical protein